MDFEQVCFGSSDLARDSQRLGCATRGLRRRES